MFATGFLVLGLCQLAEALVGSAVWERRAWRAYLWPSTAFLMGFLLWPVMVFFTSSTLHMLAHGVWAEVLMLAGAAQLALVRGKLKDPRWEATMGLAFFVSGVAFLVHEQNPWLFARSAFLHHALGWTLVIGSVFPLMRAFRPGSSRARAGYALTMLAVAVLLYCDRDVAPIFGHLSELAR
jgi:chromate transport protein ChrA